VVVDFVEAVDLEAVDLVVDFVEAVLEGADLVVG
jgi:hypothetical protein